MFSKICGHQRNLRMVVVSGVIILVLLGALFWAKARDPFSRRLFTLKTAEHGSFKCVAVLPKPVRKGPVIIYTHGWNGSLMKDGKALRQMAEMGLTVVSLEYNQTNVTIFHAQFETLLNYVDRQKWADTNAIAWVGFSLGANRTLDALAGLETRNPKPETKKLKPQLLILVSGSGIPKVDTGEDSRFNIQDSTSNRMDFSGATFNSQLSTTPHCPVLLIHGEQDEVFPVADTKRLAEVLHTNGVPVELKIIPGLPHGLEPECGVVFRSIGEYCREHLIASNLKLESRNSKFTWQSYRSIAHWQAQAPGLWMFWLPAIAWVIGWSIGFYYWRNSGSALASGAVFRAVAENAHVPEAGCEAPSATPWSGLLPKPSRAIAALRWLAVLLAAWASAETAIHLVIPEFTINQTTLSIARRFLVEPKQCADFEYLAAHLIWQNEAHPRNSPISSLASSRGAAGETSVENKSPLGRGEEASALVNPSPQPHPRSGGQRVPEVSGQNRQLRTLLEHVKLAGYDRELINWQIDETVYQEFVLSPVIELSTYNLQLSTNPNWRRALWEEFYPRIRRESSPADAASIVVRHLRERVTIVSLPDLSRDVPSIWLRQITDERGFEIIYVATLRAVGVPARLSASEQAEIFTDGKWLPAPRPLTFSFLPREP